MSVPEGADFPLTAVACSKSAGKTDCEAFFISFPKGTVRVIWTLSACGLIQVFVSV